MKNNEILDQTYNEVKALGFVENQWDFSLMCGRTPGWFSCIKARKLPMTTDAVLTLSHNVRTRATEITDGELHAEAIGLSDRLIEQAQAQTARKLLRLSGCSY